MTDVWLGVIAVAVLTMAVIQVAAIVFAARAARQMGDAVARFEHTLQPILTNLEAVSADAARVTAAASAQIERTGQLLHDLATRVDQTVMAVQESILRPARRSMAFLHSLQAILSAFRRDNRVARSSSHKPGGAEEEDALFIG